MNLSKRIVVFIGKCVGKIFYDSKYLTGKWFDTSKTYEDEAYGWGGWAWVIQCAIFKMLGYNTGSPWPIDHSCRVMNYNNIEFDVDDAYIFHRHGVYFQNTNAKITIGKGTQIAYGVGLITENHDPYNVEAHLPGKDIIIGKECWLGMNSVILPGTVLGDHTIVGAGAVVTKSFPEGYVVLGGTPAKILYCLDKEKFMDDE